LCGTTEIHRNQKENIEEQESQEATIPEEVGKRKLELHERKRGRPKVRGTEQATGTGLLEESNLTLADWIQNHRSSVYRRDGGCKAFEYHCLPCEKQVNFWRDSITYVLSHETSKTHNMGLDRLGLDTTGRVKDIEGGPCLGLNIHRHPETRLGALILSQEQWWQAGTPMIGRNNNTPSVLGKASWQKLEEELFVKHISCLCRWVAKGQACLMCSGVAADLGVVKEIAMWGYRIDLSQLAYLTCYMLCVCNVYIILYIMCIYI
jgi:hypothetical protein